MKCFNLQCLTNFSNFPVTLLTTLQRFYLDEISLHAPETFGKAWKCPARIIHVYFNFTPDQVSTVSLRTIHEWALQSRYYGTGCDTPDLQTKLKTVSGHHPNGSVPEVDLPLLGFVRSTGTLEYRWLMLWSWQIILTTNCNGGMLRLNTLHHDRMSEWCVNDTSCHWPIDECQYVKHRSDVRVIMSIGFLEVIESLSAERYCHLIAALWRVLHDKVVKCPQANRNLISRADRYAASATCRLRSKPCHTAVITTNNNDNY